MNNLTVSKYWLGGNIFGYSAAENDVFEILEIAEQSGIVGIDTSSSYSDGQSESIIGRWLKTNKNRANFTVATKVGLRSHESPKGLGSPSRIAESLYSSLDRLQTDYVDILFLHAPDPETEVIETINALLDLKDKNIVRNFGVCNAKQDDVRNYISAFEKIGIPLKNLYIQNYFNWARRGANYWYKLQEANSGERWQSVSYGLLGRGVFMPKINEFDAKSRKKMNAKIMMESTNINLTKQLDLVNDICIKNGQSLYTFALAYGHYFSDFSIIGVRNISQLSMLINFKKTVMDQYVFETIRKQIESLNLDLNTGLGDPFI